MRRRGATTGSMTRGKLPLWCEVPAWRWRGQQVRYAAGSPTSPRCGALPPPARTVGTPHRPVRFPVDGGGFSPDATYYGRLAALPIGWGPVARTDCHAIGLRGPSGTHVGAAAASRCP